jgi:pseudouridine synthase
MISAQIPFSYFLFHKPIDCISSRFQADFAGPTVYDLVAIQNFPKTLSIVGRLDSNSKGLMLFTNDNKLANAIRTPFHVSDHELKRQYKTKEYIVILLSNLKRHKLANDHSNEVMKKLETELSLPLNFKKDSKNYQTGPMSFSVLRCYQDPDFCNNSREDMGWVVEVKVRLVEGKHRQIRRVAKRSGFVVVSLTRTSIAGILELESVPFPGSCRWLTDDEVDLLKCNLL